MKSQPTASGSTDTQTSIGGIGPLEGISFGGSIKKVLGLFAAGAGLLYAVGYLVLTSHQRMLGLPQMNLSQEHVVETALSLVPLSAVAALAALGSTIGLGIGLLILVASLLPTLSRRARRWGKHGQTLVQTLVSPSSRFLSLLLGTTLTLLSMQSGSQILEQTNQLLPRGADLVQPSYPVFTGPITSLVGPNETLAKLLYNPRKSSPGTMEDSLTEEMLPLRMTLYGAFVLSSIFCLVVWWRFFRWVRTHRMTAWIRFVAVFVASISGTFLILQLFQVPVLYGFLLKANNKFPAIRLAASAESTKTQATQVPPDKPEGTLIVLGQSGSHTVIFELQARKLWWVNSGSLQPSVQVEPHDLFEGKPPSR